MSPFTPTVTYVLDIMTIATHGALVLALVLFIIKKTRHRVLIFLAKNALPIGLLYATAAMTGSLFYSDIAGYTPCVLCWYQRIFMYPQVFLFAMALWRNDKRIGPYALMLSGIGASIAAYHYYIQNVPVSITPCQLVGYSVSCTDKFVLNFGYITIPMMALTAFVVIIVAMLALRHSTRAQHHTTSSTQS